MKMGEGKRKKDNAKRGREIIEGKTEKDELIGNKNTSNRQQTSCRGSAGAVATPCSAHTPPLGPTSQPLLHLCERRLGCDASRPTTC